MLDLKLKELVNKNRSIIVSIDCLYEKEKVSNGTAIKHMLILTADTSNILHIKIRKEAYICDPYFEEDCKTRKFVKIKNSNTRKGTIVSLLKRQFYICVCCGEGIYSWSKWKVYLLTIELKYGDYKISNLCIIPNYYYGIGFAGSFSCKLSVISNRSG